jgi:hypothetical protein
MVRYRYIMLRDVTLHYGTLRYITVHYGTLRHYVTIRHGTVRYGTVRYGTVRYCNTCKEGRNCRAVLSRVCGSLTPRTFIIGIGTE